LGYCYIWEFIVSHDFIKAFEAAYGPDGEWVRLFKRGKGYIRTDLIRDCSEPTRYLTIDYWESRETCNAFREQFQDEFAALDTRCEQYTSHERYTGDFESVT
jgi:heme-degrading monooxygenase HmoA